MSSRASYTSAFKLKVISHAANTSNRAAAKHFSINEKQIREWKKNQVSLQKLPSTKRADRGQLCKWPELERELNKWVLSQRSSGYIVTRGLIRLKSIQWAEKNKNISKNFKATASWCNRFMKRNNLTLRQKTKIAQKLPSDLEDKIQQFQSFIINHRKQNNYPLAHIANMDETPMFFDIVGNKTVNKVGEKTVLVKTTGHEKTHFTVVLSCMADGTKLMPMVIFKRKLFPKKENFPAGVVVHVQARGWMDEAGCLKWIKEVWNQRPGALRRPKALLVWDMFRSHLVENVRQALHDSNTDIAVIPGGLTSVLQPLDVCLNKPFKDAMRSRWNQWMVSGDKSLTPAGKILQSYSIILSIVQLYSSCYFIKNND